jgi:hypothetical protein
LGAKLGCVLRRALADFLQVLEKVVFDGRFVRAATEMGDWRSAIHRKILRAYLLRILRRPRKLGVGNMSLTKRFVVGALRQSLRAEATRCR